MKLDDLYIEIEETLDQDDIFDEVFSWELERKGKENQYDETFAWNRCLSRLKEMQTDYYSERQIKLKKERL